jgi:hypothetical protein
MPIVFVRSFRTIFPVDSSKISIFSFPTLEWLFLFIVVVAVVRVYFQLMPVVSRLIPRTVSPQFIFLSVSKKWFSAMMIDRFVMWQYKTISKWSCFMFEQSFFISIQFFQFDKFNCCCCCCRCFIWRLISKNYLCSTFFFLLSERTTAAID